MTLADLLEKSNLSTLNVYVKVDLADGLTLDINGLPVNRQFKRSDKRGILTSRLLDVPIDLIDTLGPNLVIHLNPGKFIESVGMARDFVL